MTSNVNDELWALDPERAFHGYCLKLKLRDDILVSRQDPIATFVRWHEDWRQHGATHAGVVIADFHLDLHWRNFPRRNLGAGLVYSGDAYPVFLKDPVRMSAVMLEMLEFSLVGAISTWRKSQEECEIMIAYRMDVHKQFAAMADHWGARMAESDSMTARDEYERVMVNHHYNQASLDSLQRLKDRIDRAGFELRAFVRSLQPHLLDIAMVAQRRNISEVSDDASVTFRKEMQTQLTTIMSGLETVGDMVTDLSEKVLCDSHDSVQHVAEMIVSHEERILEATDQWEDNLLVEA